MNDLVGGSIGSTDYSKACKVHCKRMNDLEESTVGLKDCSKAHKVNYRK